MRILQIIKDIVNKIIQMIQIKKYEHIYIYKHIYAGGYVMNTRPRDLLIYYGWLNSFNSAVNSWDNEKVAQDMAKYDLIVLGDGIQDSSHGDYSNTTTIIPRIRELNSACKIFGYVTVNQTLANFKTKANQWNDLEIDGIFMDEAGYDYGKKRDEFNERVIYVHCLSKSNLCFANAWNLNHIFGTENDASYANTTYNPDLLETALCEEDYCLLESFPINTVAYTSSNGYESKSDWKTRGELAVEMRNAYGINVIGSGIIADGDNNEDDLFQFGFISACMFALDGFGTSDVSYGASSAKTKYITRPDILGIEDIYYNPVVAVDASNEDVYLRYCNNGKFILDFSNGNQISNIIKY